MNLIDMILNYYGILLFAVDLILILRLYLKYTCCENGKFDCVAIIIVTMFMMYNIFDVQIIKEKTQIYQIPNTHEYYSIDNVSGSGFLFSKTEEKSIVEYSDGKEVKRIKVDIENVNVLFDAKHPDENYVVCIYKKQNGLGDKHLDKIEIHLQQGKK